MAGLHLADTSSTLVDAKFYLCVFFFLYSYNFFILDFIFKYNYFICLIGALTSKSFSFTARPWELEVKKSIDFFDFFAYPISIFIKQSKIFRVSSFNMQFWISDSIRFFFDNYGKFAVINFFPVYIGSKTQFKLSWFELALFISNSLFQIEFCFFVFNTCFFKNSINLEVGSSLNFVSADAFTDLKDRLQIYLTFKSIISKSVFFKNQQIYQFSFAPFNFGRAVSSESLIHTHLLNESINFRFVFIFGSNLRYESPMLNSRLRLYINNSSQVKVYQFGKNFSYFFNYPVTYGGNFADLITLFSGRSKFLSKLVFSFNSCSIFGFNFFQDCLFKISVNFYSVVKQSIKFPIFLQSDFSKYTRVLFETQFNSGIVFKPALSIFSSFFFRFNTFLFNSKYSFKFIKNSKFFGSGDFNFFLKQNFFFFKNYFNFIKTQGSVFNCAQSFDNNYIIPSCNFLVGSTNYLSPSNKIFKVSKISKFLIDSSERNQFSIFLYLFKTVFGPYRIYRELYFTLFDFEISKSKSVKYNFNFRFDTVLSKFLMFKAIKKDLSLKLPFMFQSYTLMFNFLAWPSFAKIYFNFTNIYIKYLFYLEF